MSELQNGYQKAIKFAASKHALKGQLIPGSNLPYAVHVSNVAMEILVAARHSDEFDELFAVQVALLHDVLEDTDTTFEEVRAEFGDAIASAVLALTKDSNLPKEKRMNDSLERIMRQPKEVWSVKLADRITNLQPPPPHWNQDKIAQYHQQAIQIQDALKGGNEFLENRLKSLISAYSKHF